MISYDLSDLMPFLLTIPLSLILDSRSLGDFSFLSVFTFHYRARYLVGTFSSMLRCLAARQYRTTFFTLAVYRGVRILSHTQRSRSRSSTNVHISEGLYRYILRHRCIRVLGLRGPFSLCLHDRLVEMCVRAGKRAEQNRGGSSWLPQAKAASAAGTLAAENISIGTARVFEVHRS